MDIIMLPAKISGHLCGFEYVRAYIHVICKTVRMHFRGGKVSLLLCQKLKKKFQKSVLVVFLL